MRFSKRGSVYALLLLLAACAKPISPIAPEGRLSIIDMTAEPLTDKVLLRNWVAEGVSMERLVAPDLAAISFPKTSSGPVLKITRYQADYLFARRTAARLAASPFFRWTWRAEENARHLPPYGIVIGFRGGRVGERNWNDRLFGWSRNKELSFDRSITLIPRVGFEPSRIEKVSDENAIISYGAGLRGGGRWRSQIIDLQALYTRAWPADKIAPNTVVFIGFSVKGGQSDHAIFLHNMSLSR